MMIAIIVGLLLPLFFLAFMLFAARSVIEDLKKENATLEKERRHQSEDFDALQDRHWTLQRKYIELLHQSEDEPTQDELDETYRSLGVKP